MITAPGPVIIGAGLAGLVTALELAPTPCMLITAGALTGDCASAWAQGGLAAAVGPDDSPARHAVDTIAAGAGLCHPDVVERITAAGPAAVERLQRIGARLDRAPDGSLRLGLEAAHSRHRIVHAAGDGTGAELVRAAVAAAQRTASITVLEHTRALRILTDPEHGGVVGVFVADASGSRVIPTDQVVLATGGLGGLFLHTTNPTGATGSGLALGLRAGAQARDLEMVQFHPTALDVGADPLPLVSEAVRGDGAILVRANGQPLMADCLAPRDVVARAVWAAQQGGQRVFLDTTSIGSRFATRFPAITAACATAGLDPARQPLPIRAAAHYHMGGLVVDGQGRTTVPGLWAVGEVASTGLHGANRLASNSLLEAVVCAQWVAVSLQSAQRRRPEPGWEGRLTSAGAINTSWSPTLPSLAAGSVAASSAAASSAVASSVPTPLETGAQATTSAIRQVRSLVSGAAGVVREQASLTRAIRQLRPLAHDDDAALIALMVCWSALHRTESRGAHTRSDYPGEQPATHTLACLDGVLGELGGAQRRERSA